MTARLRVYDSFAFPSKRRMIVRLLLAWWLIPLAGAMAQEPLRELINRELAPPSTSGWPKASDAEFLRRVSIDLNGMPPNADDARAFLNDADPAKREKRIDQLMASPLFTRHLSTTLDVMLMERRPNTNVSQDEWQAWLMKSVRDNKPWNVIAREILTADGDVAQTRAAARFYLDRNSEPHVITRDLGRVFFGRDMQCNQCHDSPIVADYLQRDYHGLLAIASTGYEVKKKVGEKDVAVLGERSGADLTFESVFIKGTLHRTAARLPGGVSIVEPTLYPGEEYTIAPADGVRAVPKFSRRAALAEQATNGSNLAFNENIVNRLWAMMLGRGLVHPLDMMHPDNSSASPSLLKQLGDRMVAANFDMKWFLRELAMSDVYQRPFDLTPDVIDSLAAATLERDQLASKKDPVDVAARDASKLATTADDTFTAAEAAMLPVAVELDAARTQYVDAKKKLDDAQKALADATGLLTTKTNISATLQQALTPLQAATAALPNDAELAATAAKLTARTQQIATELPALQQAVTDKSAAVTPVNNAFAATKATLDSTSQKLQPLLEAVRIEEAKFVAARAVMQVAEQEAESIKNRLAIAERISLTAQTRASINEATQAHASSEAAFVFANAQVNEYLTVVQQRTAAMQTCEQEMAAASSAMSNAQTELHSRQTATVVLSEAKAAIDRAASLLPADESIATSAKTLSEKLAASQLSAKASEEFLLVATQKSQAARDAMTAAQTQMAESTVELQRRQQVAAQCGAAVTESRASVQSADVAFQKSLEPVPTDLSARFALSQLKPLTPEQLCWTVFKVTTVYDRYVVGEVAELDKTAPLTDEQRKDPSIQTVRAAEIEQRTFDKLKGNIGSYVQLYGGGPGQPQNDFYASPDQALFTANGSAINSWVVPASDNATERIIKATDPRIAAEELYLGVLTRMPSEGEIAEVTSFLSTRPDRTKAAQELVWGLISSAEFRFNR